MRIKLEIESPNGNTNIRAIHNVIEECLAVIRQRGQLESIETISGNRLQTEWGDYFYIEVDK